MLMHSLQWVGIIIRGRHNGRRDGHVQLVATFTDGIQLFIVHKQIS